MKEMLFFIPGYAYFILIAIFAGIVIRSESPIAILISLIGLPLMWMLFFLRYYWLDKISMDVMHKKHQNFEERK